MSLIQVNPNFHTLTKGSILEKEDSAFRDYRWKWEEWPKNFRIGDFPLHLDVEATSVCNLRCPFCATSYKDTGPKGYMEFETFKKIIEEGAEHGLYAIKFNSGARGEPLLHSSLDKIAASAKTES